MNSGIQKITGRCVEVGDDETGQPRLVIHTTREELARFSGNLAFADVVICLAAEAESIANEVDDLKQCS